MRTLTLIHREIDGLYHPKYPDELGLIQHLMNNDLYALNEKGLEKLKIVAKAHGWFLDILEEI